MMTHKQAQTTMACYQCGQERILLLDDEKLYIPGTIQSRRGFACWCPACGSMSPARLSPEAAAASWDAMQQVLAERRIILEGRARA